MEAPAQESNDNLEATLVAVDDEIKRFEEWFTRELSEQPLTKYEKAILKTFLVHRTLGKF